MHRERVIAALNHVTPDRCPWQATFTPEFAERLRADMGLDAACTTRMAAATRTTWRSRSTKMS